jgi:uncharacterized integral membrane protein
MSDQTSAGGPGSARTKTPVSEKLLNPKSVIGLLIVVLAVWFIIANNTEVRVHLWVAWVSARLWLVLLGVFVAGLATGWLLKRRTVKR